MAIGDAYRMIQVARELLILSEARRNQFLKILARARHRRAKRDDGGQRVLEARFFTVALIARRHPRQAVSLVDGAYSAESERRFLAMVNSR